MGLKQGSPSSGLPEGTGKWGQMVERLGSRFINQIFGSIPGRAK